MDENTEPVPGDRHASGLGEGFGAQLSFHGGYRMGRPRGGYDYVAANTGRQATLTLFPKGLRINASDMNPSKTSVPTWEARYDELMDVSAVGFFPRAGVRFYADTTIFGLIVFYTLSRQGVLEALSMRGVAVNFTPIRFGYSRIPPLVLPSHRRP
jgi:hypothetical protein